MKYVERAFPWLLVAPALLPVVIWNGVIYPYLVPKTLAFYAVSLVTLGAFFLLVAHGRKFFWSRLARVETWVPGVLLALAYLTSYFGIGFYHSFWSIFDRGDGLLMLTCAVGSFYLLLLYADAIFFERLLRIVAAVGSVVAIYGIGEWFVTGGRIGSLLGNAAFFAGYLGIALFATLAAARALSLGWRRAAYAGAAVEVVAIVLTATRGTMLALGVALLLVLVHLAFPMHRQREQAEEKNGRGRTLARIVLAGVIVAGGLFFVFRANLAHVPFSPIARVATISTKSPDVASRLFIWQHMLGEIVQRPVLGVGAEHIDYLFNKFYDPTQIQEQWFDRSHNAFLDYAAQYGIGGFLLYLALIGSFFIAARRFFRKGDRALAAALTLLAVVYAVQNFFVFDTISSFWLLLALLATALATSTDDLPEALALPAWLPSASWGALVVCLALIVPVSVRPAIAAYDLAHAYAYQLTDVAKSVSYLHNGFALGTYGNLEYGYEAYAMYADTQSVQLTGSARTAAYQEALGILSIDFAHNPYDARTALYLAHTLSLAPPGVPVNDALLSAALAQAIRLSPKRSQPWYILVNVALMRANTFPAGSSGRTSGYAAAQDLLNRYIALVPTLSEPHYVLAQIELAAGDLTTANAEAAQGKAYYQSDLPTALRATSYYESVQDWPDTIFFLQQVVQLDPANLSARYDLAKAMYLAGDRVGAEKLVAVLRASDPSILQTDPAFLSAITAYEQSVKPK